MYFYVYYFTVRAIGSERSLLHHHSLFLYTMPYLSSYLQLALCSVIECSISWVGISSGSPSLIRCQNVTSCITWGTRFRGRLPVRLKYSYSPSTLSFSVSNQLCCSRLAGLSLNRAIDTLSIVKKDKPAPQVTCEVWHLPL